MEDEAWLTTLLSASRAALEKAENQNFPRPPLIEDLRRFTAEIEHRLTQAQSTDAAS